MTRVSVVLSSFNHAKYIEESIDSVLRQSFTDFELIVFDDASSDNSWELISRYSDSRIRAIRRDAFRDAVDPYTPVFLSAKADFIAIQHSDDVWEPEKLERQVAFLDAHPDVGAVFSNARAIGEDGAPLNDEGHFYSNVFAQANRSRHEWLRFFFAHGNALCHPSVLIRRSCYEDCGLYPITMGQLGDFDMWVRLCLRYEIHVLPEELVRFRVRDNEANASGNRRETRIRSVYEFYRILQNYRRLDTFQDLVKVFPSARKHYRERGTDIEFALAMTMLEDDSHPFSKLVGQDILFEVVSDPKRAARIKRLYDFDGNSFIELTGRNDVFSLEAVAERDREITNLNRGAAARDHEIAALRRAVSDRDENVAVLQQWVAARDERIAALTQARDDRDERIAALTQARDDRDERIAALTQARDDLTEQISSLDEGLARRGGEIAALKGCLGERDAQLDALRGALDTRDERILALDRAVAERDLRLDALLNSISWKISAPLRAIGRGARRLRSAEFDVRKAVRAGARYVYRNLPLSPSLKLRLRSRALRHFGSFVASARAPAFVPQRMHARPATPGAMEVQRILSYLNEPALGGATERWRYSRFMHHLWWSRLDLQRVFDLGHEDGRAAFATWYLLSARHEYRLTESAYPAYLLEDLARSGDSQVEKAALELLATQADDTEAPPGEDALPDTLSPEGLHPEFGANLIGYARGEFGMGEHVRMVARACAATDVPFSIIDFEEGGFHGKGDDSVAQWISNEQKFGTNIFHINADAFPALFFHFTPGFFDAHVNVGYWAWELANCPEEFDLALNMVDEVWAISEFVRDAFAQHSKVPVVNMPLAVSVPVLDRQYSKGYFGLPEDEFTFLFTFDAASYLDRKNPIGAVKAFKWAFPDPGQKVRLVLKTMNVPENEPLWNALKAEIGRDPRIQVLANRMTRDEVLGLNSVCDAFVSLHRSEGFGRCIAESMWLGKPVVVTNYSGSRDFANEATACVVDFELIPVPEGNYPCWREQVWADPDFLHAGWFMRRLVEDTMYRQYIAKAGQSFIQANFSEQAVGLRYRKRLAKIAERRARPIAPAAPGKDLARATGSEAPQDRIIGNVDLPRQDAAEAPTVRGNFELAGWAISDSGVAGVEVSLDGTPVDGTHYGILRPDIGAAYPDVAGSARSGFFCRIDSTAHEDGDHRIEVAVVGQSGGSSVSGVDIRIDNSVSDYDEWLAQNSPDAPENMRNARMLLKSMAERPLVSLVATVSRPADAALLSATLASLREQIYPCWELVVGGGGARDPELREIAGDLGLGDRIRFAIGSEPDAVSTLRACSGAFAGPLDFGDVLDPRALLSFASALCTDPLLDLVYADEDRLRGARRVEPVFKPGWSPTLFRESRYVGRPWLARASSVKRLLDGLPGTTDGLESGLLAELGKDPRSVAHIPMVLCSRREASAATGSHGKSIPCDPGNARGHRPWLARDGPRVSIIIPTRLGNPMVVEKCLVSLFGRTMYDNYEVIVIANNIGADTDASAFLARWPARVIHREGPFNWSAVNNLGARSATGDYLLFMNDDIEVHDRGWLASMIEAAQLPGVGVVGATLRYPNGTLQHAGLALDRHGSGASHLFRFHTGREPPLRQWVSADRECSAVTGACLLTKASIFHELGGFDEAFPLVCNDTDYCLRAAHGGYRCLVAADAGLVHHEGISRAGLTETRDVESFRARWGNLLDRGDPYLNPNLSPTEEWAVNPRAAGSLAARSNWLLVESVRETP